jgi:hypothetical protein
MLVLAFEGWFQCRLSTDPDPYDEPRGISGSTFAFSGEPDLDRIIRFQNAVSQRSHCPEVTVRTTAVMIDSAMVPNHPWLGSKVQLKDNAMFEGRNGLVADDGYEPIVPFNISIEGDAFAISRRHADELKTPYTELRAIASFSPGEISLATSISDPIAERAKRRALLETDLQSASSEARVNLESRIEHLSNSSLGRLFFAKMSYSFRLLGSNAEAKDDYSVLPRPISLAEAWYVDFWMGGWDPDALCGYTRGYIKVPLMGVTGASNAIPTTAKEDAYFAAGRLSPQEK